MAWHIRGNANAALDFDCFNARNTEKALYKYRYVNTELAYYDRLEFTMTTANDLRI